MATIASQLVFHPLVSQSLKYGTTTLGRDKVYRAIQYFSRFLAWYLLQKDDKVAAERWAALKAHIGIARKLMRLGKPMEHLQAALRTCFAPGPAVEQITAIGRQIGYFGYLTYDVLVWAYAIKFITLKPETAKKILKTSNRFWFAGILFSIANSISKSMRLARELRKLKMSKTWGEKDLAEETQREARLNDVEVARAATNKQFIIDMLDVWIPATGAGILDVNEGTLGIFGLISSLLGAKAQWEAVNSKS